MKVLWRVVLPVITIASCLIGASCSTHVALSEATMCAGLDSAMRPLNPTTMFSARATELNLSVKILNAPRDTEIRAELFYVKGPTNTINKMVSAGRVIVEGTTYIGFPFARGGIGAWPVGDYRVDLYVKSEKALDLTFNITN